MRIAALGDIHCTARSEGLFAPLFCQIASMADVLLLCGDLTDFGAVEEARILAQELSGLSIPVIAILGNHDYDSGHPDEVRKILAESGIRMLDGDSVVIGDVGIAGVKGFGGGFGRRLLGAFGEDAIKRFVQESLEESRKLEAALSVLETTYRVAMTHYAPIMETTAPEPPELYPFLGSSHLEDVLDHHEVHVAFHGHAHYGTPEGKTSTGIPVFNVALPLLRRHFHGQPPVRIFELGQMAPDHAEPVCPPLQPQPELEPSAPA